MSLVCACVCVSLGACGVRVEGVVEVDVCIVWWFEQSTLLSAHLSLSYTITIDPQGENHYHLVIVNTAFTK